MRVKDLTEDQLDKIREIVDNYKTEGDLRREVSLNIKRLMEIRMLQRNSSPSWTSSKRAKH